MTQKINATRLALIKSYERFVTFVYDDLHPVLCAAASPIEDQNTLISRLRYDDQAPSGDGP